MEGLEDGRLLAFEAKETEGDDQESGSTVDDHHGSQLNHPARRIALRRVRAFLNSARTFGQASALHRSLNMRRIEGARCGATGAARSDQPRLARRERKAGPLRSSSVRISIVGSRQD